MSRTFNRMSLSLRACGLKLLQIRHLSLTCASRRHLTARVRVTNWHGFVAGSAQFKFRRSGHAPSLGLSPWWDFNTKLTK